MSYSQMLYRLQTIDSQLDQFHSRIGEINAALSRNIEQQIAEDNLLKSRNKLETEQQNLTDAERAVNNQRIKIEQTESTLYSGKIQQPKELQDLQNEINALKRYQQVLEDRQIDCMINVENALTALEIATNEYEKIKSAWTLEKSKLHEELTNIEQEITRLETEKIAALAPIPTDLVELYNQIRKQRKGVAVVKIEGKSCSACGTMLTPSILQAVQSVSLIRCPTCSRILYG
jgi:predicted  nucleic acid-binding Zn-ribbon protein